MGYKCAPQLLGLVNGEPPVKTNSKTGKHYKNRHRANGKAIAMEMGPERASKSKTLDRSRSHLNTYEGLPSGESCWAAMMDDVEAYRMPVKLRNGKTAYRRLSEKMKEELVPGWSIIINPPPEMTVGWSDADYDRFDADSLDVLGELCPIFRRKNVRGKAIHRDEGREEAPGEFGRHTHWLGDSLDDEGRYCGSIINGDLYDLINRQYPAMMRDRGWELDDLDVTDWEKYRDDPDYKAERDEKRRNQGREVNRVIADERRDARMEVAMERHEARELRDVVAQLEQQADTIIADALDEATEIRVEARKYASDTKKEADRDRAEATRDRNAADGDAQDADEYAQQTRAGADAYATQTEDGADEYARTTKQNADDAAKETRAAADRDAEAKRQAADEYAAKIREQADEYARTVEAQLREKVLAATEEERKKYEQLKQARVGLQTALQGDLRTFQAQEAKQNAEGFLAATVAVVRPLVEASGVRVPAKVTPGPAASSVYDQLRAQVARMDANRDDRAAAQERSL